MNYTAQSLVEMSDLRNQLIDRVEVLSKVKELFLIPGIEMISTNMVANFYEVDAGTLRVCYNRNKKEIDSDGTFVKTSKELRGSLQNVTTLKKDNIYKTFVTLSNGEQAELVGKSTYFSPRAVLRIGMLLRDSEVAKEVRTQLLNTFEAATPEQRVEAIDEEGSMLLNIIRAGSPEMMAVELGKYREFMNRHIAKLEDEKKGLKTELDIVHNEIVTWTPSQIVRRLIGSIGYQMNGRMDIAWGNLRQNLYHHHGISLEGRKRGSKKPYISFIHDDEWTKVLQEVYALAKKHNVDVVKAVGLINAEQIPGFSE